jgi:predicted NUDIX family phosphoesterase
MKKLEAIIRSVITRVIGVKKCYNVANMGKEAFVIPRNNLIETGFIPSERTEGSYFYCRIHSFSELKRLFQVAYRSGEFRSRYGVKGVEANPNVQQLIIYAYVQRSDGKFLLYQRAGKDNYGEHRLAEQVSVGIGGHIEATDLNLTKSFYRELDEEAEVLVNGEPHTLRDAQGNLKVSLIKKYLRISPVGFIKDERDAVGRVHFGIVCKIAPRVETVEIRLRTESGQENIECRYVTAQEYTRMLSAGCIKPEGWTEIVVREEILCTR